MEHLGEAGLLRLGRKSLHVSERLGRVGPMGLIVCEGRHPGRGDGGGGFPDLAPSVARAFSCDFLRRSATR